MKIKELLAYVVGLLVVLAAIWLITGSSLLTQKVFNPLFEQVRRDTFESSKSYRDGMAQELRSLQLEYIKADPTIKPALAAAIKHKAAGIPEDALPIDLQLFIKGL